MHVACIFPVGADPKKQFVILEVLEKKAIARNLNELGASPLELRFPPAYYTYVPSSGSIDPSALKKGEGILEVLRSIPDTLDYVIVCDGSGKIPYEKIVDVFSELVSNSTCVMAERDGDNKAISEIRFLIERWEIFVLKHFFNHPKEIADGQCGLWGYYAKEMVVGDERKKIKLTAIGYDIELDLLSEVLCKDLNYSFVHVELPPSSGPLKTSFTFEDNLRKLDFLIKKYPKLSSCLQGYLKEYEKIAEEKIAQLSDNDKKIWIAYCDKLKEIKVV